MRFRYLCREYTEGKLLHYTNCRRAYAPKICIQAVARKIKSAGRGLVAVALKAKMRFSNLLAELRSKGFQSSKES